MKEKWSKVKIFFNDTEEFYSISNILSVMELDCFESDEEAIIIYTKDSDLPEKLADRLDVLTDIPEMTVEVIPSFWNKVLHGDFKSIEVGGLTVKSKEHLSGDEDIKKTIIINPAQAFGSGQHATTRQCIELISWVRTKDNIKNMLEPGCGSSILSIYADKIGIKDIYAFDNDLTALYNSIENQHLNDAPVSTFCGDLSFLRKSFDLVAANIFAHILVANHDILIDYVNTEKYLVLSGIEDDQADEVQEVFSDMKKIRRISFEGWTSFLFRKKD